MPKYSLIKKKTEENRTGTGEANKTSLFNLCTPTH